MLFFFLNLQVGNAIKSSLDSAALKSKEGGRGIQVEITPTASRISRNAVTSLSIRGHRWKRNGEMHTHTHTEEKEWGEKRENWGEGEKSYLLDFFFLLSIL